MRKPATANGSLRVLHVNNEKTWRGGERQTLLTAGEQRRQGIDSWIACRAGAPLHKLAAEQDIPVIPLPVLAPLTLVRLAASINAFDIVHAHTGRAHSMASLAALLRRKPIVLSRRVDFRPPDSAFNHWKYSRAAKVVCVSKCIQGILTEWGIPVEKTAVIYEAVPGSTFLSRDAARRELARNVNAPLKRHVVGNIAALVGHKDHATLLRAARAVMAVRRDVSFVIVGEGDLKSSLMRLRDELGLVSDVHFTGFIPQAQRLLAAFDAFAMSSSMEGLGTIVLDAGLAGVPVAATAAGGLPEAVLDEETGLLAPAGDGAALGAAVLRLLSDSALAGRLSRSAQARVRSDFSPEQMARQYGEVYRTVAKPADAS